ncbi:MAG: type II toxin-antitoxin system VapC family toxin [Armatimonadetes bacterium]|nr:type II toxin-antitoxin system VapC family toxin [Armatimonadota bacterium]
MRKVFADTVFWLAITGPRDQWHDMAVWATDETPGRAIVTTEEVLTEFLAARSQTDPEVRRLAAELVRELLADPDTTVIPQSHGSFLRGLALYEQREDKHYSLVDCISMATMHAEGLTDVLTNDRHFVQEGFRLLMRRDHGGA